MEPLNSEELSTTGIRQPKSFEAALRTGRQLSLLSYLKRLACGSKHFFLPLHASLPANAMHDFRVATGVIHLPVTERLFLWAIRAWSAHHSDVTPIWWSLDRAFAQEGMHCALPPFHQLMSALFAGLKRWPDIRCVRCPHLGSDEERLLSVLACLQHDDEVGARRALRDWVLRSAAREMCEHAAQCAAIAAAAGLRFTCFEEEVSAVACAALPERTAAEQLVYWEI